MTNHTGKFAAAIFAGALAGMILAGCGNTGGVSNQQNAVYAIAVALTSADTIALNYVTLPLCGPKHPTRCSDAAVTTQIKARAREAHDAVIAAEEGKGTLAAAQAAVDALVKATPHTGA